MIRINLLTEGRRPVAVRQPRFTAGEGFDSANLTLVGIVLLGLVAALVHNYLLGSELGRKRAEVADAQREVEILAPIIQEVQEYREKTAELERKMEIVNNLRANQLGPVRIMDSVSRAVPELLWLRRLDVRTNDISITGEAFNTNAVANFIENLDRIPEFGEPILKDTSQRGQVYTFVVDFPYSFTSRAADDLESEELAGG